MITLTKIKALLCFSIAGFFVCFIPNKIIAQDQIPSSQNDYQTLATEQIIPLLEARLQVPGGDTARYFILEDVRNHCKGNYDCLQHTYDVVLRKLSDNYEYLKGLLVAEEIINIAKQNKDIDSEVDGMEWVAIMYGYMNNRKMQAFCYENLVTYLEEVGYHEKALKNRSRLLENRAWYLGEVEKALPEMKKILQEAVEKNYTDMANSLRIRIKHMCEEFGFDEELVKVVEELEKMPFSDPLEYSEHRFAFHAASGRGDLLLKEKKYEKAKEYYLKAFSIYQPYENNAFGAWQKIYILLRIANIEWDRKEFTEAKTFLDQTYSIANEANMNDEAIECLKMKVKIAEIEKNYEDAFLFTKEISSRQAVIDSLQGNFDMEKHQIQLHREQLETEKEKQTLELQLSKSRLNSTIVIIILVTLLAVGLFINFKKQKKRKEELAVQNDLIQKQAEQLKQLDSAKSRFFANVSHELRTPLSLILGPIRTLLKEKQVTDKQTQLLQMANQGSQNLQLLVNEILDLGKLESGKMELTKSPVNLASYFKYYFAQFESLGYNKGITYGYDLFVPKNVSVLLDKEKCRQLVFNLLSNAFKFTPSGGNINVTLKLEGKQLFLQVNDSGKGIHPGDLPHVFDRYFQTNRPDATASGGTGIGLALCQESAKLFGGNISVESILGKGTSFKVKFPVELVESQSLEEDLFNEMATGFKDVKEKPDQFILPMTAPPSPSTGSEKPTVLVVEDNPELRAYIQLVLNQHYQVAAAENGQAALDLIAADGHPDLIISDLMMPVMDGYQFLEKLKDNPATQQIPAIMLTARVEKDDRLKALRIGVDDYLTKPFDEEELLVRIGNLLTNQNARRQATIEESKQIGKPTGGLSDTDREWLESFEEFVRQHLAKSYLSIPMLADEFAMSMSTLLRQLKRLTGLTPQKYLVEMRLDAARLLFAERRFSSVARVAREVGYNDVRGFSKSFTKRYGKKPSQFATV